MHTLIALLRASGIAQSSASEFRNAHLSMRVPPGFEGPVEAAPAPDMKTVAFTRRYADRPGGTLLQITTFSADSSSESVPEAQKSEMAASYLKQFLQGVERQRTQFEASAIQRTTLAGAPAARVSWRGRASGLAANGVMYTVILDRALVSLHTQDLDGAPAAHRESALRAIEGIEAIRAP